MSFSSSSLDHSVFLMLGSNHSNQRALHCLADFRCKRDAILDHWFLPYFITAAFSISSSVFRQTPPFIIIRGILEDYFYFMLILNQLLFIKLIIYFLMSLTSIIIMCLLFMTWNVFLMCLSIDCYSMTPPISCTLIWAQISKLYLNS
jgi:hypothetical protein